MTAIEKMAEWVAKLTLGDIPPSVRNVACNCFLDTLGVALAGAVHPAVNKLRSVAAAQYRDGMATVLGGKRRMSALCAALVNGAAAHVLDFDDNCYSGFVHGSAVLVPAALAVAEAENASGADLITAFVAGCEVEFAVGDAATRHIYEKGWWTTGVLGPIGAAAAAARLMKLDGERTGYALGIATAEAGGAKSCFGTDAKAVLCGRAAERGVVDALFAREGCSGPLNALRHARGFAHLVNDDILEDESFADFGKNWRILEPGIDIKRVPVCLSAHAALDAVMDIIAREQIAASDIALVECDVGPVVTANLVYEYPKTPQQAQFSLPFAIGCMLVHGDVSLAHLTEQSLQEAALQDAMQRVTTVTTDYWRPDGENGQRYPEGALVTVTTTDGRRFQHFNGFARGTTARPLSEREISRKFMTCATDAIGESRAALLAEQLRDLATLPEARSLFASRNSRAVQSG